MSGQKARKEKGLVADETGSVVLSEKTLMICKGEDRKFTNSSKNKLRQDREGSLTDGYKTTPGDGSFRNCDEQGAKAR